MANSITTLINISQDDDRSITSSEQILDGKTYLLYMVDSDGGSKRDKAVTLDALTDHVIGENDYKVKTSDEDGSPDYLAAKMNQADTGDGSHGDIKFGAATLESEAEGIEGEVQHLGDVNLTGAISGEGSISITGDAEAANVTVTKGGTLTASKANGAYVKQTEVDGEIELTNTANSDVSNTITASSVTITSGEDTTAITSSQATIKDTSDDNGAFLTAESLTFNDSLSDTALTAAATMNSGGFTASGYEYDSDAGAPKATSSMTLSSSGFALNVYGDSYTDSAKLTSSSFVLSYGGKGGGNSTTMTGDSITMADSGGTTTLTLKGGTGDPTATLTNSGLAFSSDGDTETLTLDGTTGNAVVGGTLNVAGALAASGTLSTTAGLLVSGTSTVSGSASFGGTVTSSYTGSPYWAFRNNNFLSLTEDSDALLTYDVVAGGLVFVANTGSSSIAVTVYDEADGTTYEHTVSRRHAAAFLCVGVTTSGTYPVFKMLG